MDVNEVPHLRHLRWQRNAAAVVAVLLVLASFGLTLPVSLGRYRALRAVQAELVDLQFQVNHTQGQIVIEQRHILELQRQIIDLREN